MSNDTSTRSDRVAALMAKLPFLRDRAERRRRAARLAEAEYNFKRELVEARRDRKLSQGQVADLLGQTQPSISAFEDYDNDPKLSTIRRYALAIGAEIEYRVVLDPPVSGATTATSVTATSRARITPSARTRLAEPRTLTRQSVDGRMVSITWQRGASEAMND